MIPAVGLDKLLDHERTKVAFAPRFHSKDSYDSECVPAYFGEDQVVGAIDITSPLDGRPKMKMMIAHNI